MFLHDHFWLCLCLPFLLSSELRLQPSLRQGVSPRPGRTTGHARRYMSKPVRYTASSPSRPSVPSRAVDEARRTHERDGTWDSGLWDSTGKTL